MYRFEQLPFDGGIPKGRVEIIGKGHKHKKDWTQNSYTTVKLQPKELKEQKKYTNFAILDFGPGYSFAVQCRHKEKGFLIEGYWLPSSSHFMAGAWNQQFLVDDVVEDLLSQPILCQKHIAPHVKHEKLRDVKNVSTS